MNKFTDNQVVRASVYKKDLEDAQNVAIEIATSYKKLKKEKALDTLHLSYLKKKYDEALLTIKELKELVSKNKIDYTSSNMTKQLYSSSRWYV
jgi:hypothetical protein